MKSRMKEDFHVRFRWNVEGKFPCVTRLYETRDSHTVHRKTDRQDRRQKYFDDLQKNTEY